MAARRKLEDLTVGPVITWDNKKIKAHIDAVANCNGAKVAFGGKELKNHTIPSVYGAYEPTAVQVPLKSFVDNFKLCTTELFGPFQVIVPYNDQDVDTVLNCINRMDHHVTASVVSNDGLFFG